MATITSLGFSIFSRYDGTGVRRARSDLTSFDGGLRTSSNSLSSWSGRMKAALATAIAFGPALIPIAAHLTAGAAAFGAMAAAAGSAAAIYGAALTGAIDRTLAMAKAGKALAPSQKAFISSVEGMKGAWEKFIVATQGKTLAVATTVVQGLTAGIGKLKPVVDALHPSIKTVADAFKNWMQGSGLDRFIDIVKNQGVAALNSLIKAGRDVLAVLGEGFRVFAPLGVQVAMALERGAAALRGWAEGGGFSRFLSAVKENAPQVEAFFSALWAALKNVATATAGLAPLSLTLATALLQIIAACPPGVIQAIAIAFVALRSAMLGMMIISGLITVVKALRLAWVTLNFVFVASPIGFIITAIVALIAAIVLIATKTTWFQTAWTYAWNAIKAAAEVVWNALTIAWNAFVTGLTTAWTAVSSALTTAWNAVWNAMSLVVTTIWSALTTAWSAFVGGLTTAWNTVSAALTTAWNTVWNALSTAAQTIWTAMQGAWNAVVMAFSTVWTTVSAALTTAWNTVWNALSTAAQAVWTAMQVAWQAFITALQTIYSAVSGALSAAWSAFWNGLQTAAQAVWTAMQAAWQAFITALQTIYSAVSGALSAAWSAFWNGLQTAAQAVWTVMQAAWQVFMTAVQTIFSTVSAALTAAWNVLWNALKVAAQAVWTAMQVAWQAFMTAVQTIFSTVSAALTVAWNTVWNALKVAAQFVWTAMQVAWQVFMTAVNTIWTTFSAAFTAAWNIFWTAIKTVGSTIWDAIKVLWNTFIEGIKAIWEAFSTFFKDVWNTVWTWVKDKAKEIWDAIKGYWQDFIDGIKEIWTKASTWIKDKWSEVWNSLKATAKKLWGDIGGVIEKAINGIIGIINFLIKGFNNVASFLHINVEIGEIDKVSLPGLADGGVVEFAYGGMTGGPKDMKKGGTLSGYAPGKDTVHAVLSRGEGVLTPEAVRGLGGSGFVNSANKTYAGHRGAGRGAKSFGANGMQQFAVGGMTAAALSQAGVPVSAVIQGEHSNGSLSGGTHSGTGAVDLPPSYSVAALRAAGFAAWLRGPEQGFAPHIHAVLMNSPGLSPQAAAQVADFKNGGDGLGAGGGSGGGPPSWLEPLLGKVGEIISNVAQGIPLGGILGPIFGGSGESDKKDDGGGLFGTGIGPDIGPDITPGDNLGDAFKKAAGAVASFLIPGVGDLGKFLLGLIPDDAWNFGFKWATDKLKGFVPGAGGFGDMAIDMGSKLIKGAIDFMIGKNAEKKSEAEAFVASLSGSGALAGDVASYSGMAAKALASAGLPAGELNEFLALMAAESGGNPKAINGWDSNAMIGQASRGLMQVIPSTFAAYRDPSLPNDIFNPMANIQAAANYIKAKYGNDVPGSPYAVGTAGATPGLHMVGELGPEMVMFGGGEKVLSAAGTQSALAGTTPAGSAVTGAPQEMADSLEGKSFEEVALAAQEMQVSVQNSWAEVNASTTAAWNEIAPTLTGVSTSFGVDIPVALETMRAKSAATWLDMNLQATTQWALMRDTTLLEFNTQIGTTLPASILAMQTAWTAMWVDMTLQATTQWALIRDVTFVEFLLQIGTTLPAAILALQTAWTTMWTDMTTQSTTQWALIKVVFTEMIDHMSVLMPTAATTMNTEVTAAFTEMTAAVNAALDTSIAKIQEFIAATQAAIAAAAALQAAQASAAAAGGGGVVGGGGSGDAGAAVSSLGLSGLVTQGPNSTGVAASAGTHDGGGVYDFGTTSTSTLQALQGAGFAAWIRGNGDGMAPHIHAVYMADPNLSAQAAWQVQNYQAGGSGLGIPGNLFTGTSGANSGWNWVGEHGPELMKFRGGEQVRSNEDMRREYRLSRGEQKVWADANRRGSDHGDIHVAFTVEVQGNADAAAIKRLEDETIPKLRAALQQGIGKR